jgi:tape measure domain-containing protein
MAFNIGDAFVSVGADLNPLKRDLSEASRLLQGFGGTNILSGLTGGFLSLGNTVKTVLGGFLAFKGVEAVFSNIRAAFDDLADSMVGFNARIEQTSIGWTFLLGNAQRAQAEILALEQLAALSPFRFEGLERDARRLAAVGYPLKDLNTFLTELGNLVAGIGGGEREMQTVMNAISTMTALTVVHARQLNELASAGIPAWKILSDATHESTERLRKDMMDGSVSAKTFIDALRDYAGKRFPDAMEKTTQTWNGAWATIRDQMQIFGATAFKPLFDAMRDVVVQIGNFTRTPLFLDWAARISVVLETVVQGFQSLAPTIGNAFANAFEVVMTIGQDIYKALQWINPFARHSPSLVEQVQTGVGAIMSQFSRLAGVSDPLGVAAAAMRGFTNAAASGLAAYQASVDRANAKTMAIFGASVPAAYLQAVHAVRQTGHSTILSTPLMSQNEVSARIKRRSRTHDARPRMESRNSRTRRKVSNRIRMRSTTHARQSRRNSAKSNLRSVPSGLSRMR